MKTLNRRQFLMLAGLGSAGAGAALAFSDPRWFEWNPAGIVPASSAPPSRWATEARYYISLRGEGSLNCASCHGKVSEPLPVSYCHTPHTGAFVKCSLCPHGCVLADGERGLCRTRENRGGALYSTAYGNPCALHIDPIEKKPLFHFLPTAAAFSLATGGCNLRCLYCQNWQISQITPEETQHGDLPPDAVARAAAQVGAPVVAYTYSEPTAFYEYVLDASRAARRAGLRNVVVSAGFINPEPLRELCGTVDAIKIDLKGFNRSFYRDVCGARLEPVLEAIRTIHRAGVHLEIVNLVVPTLNDSPDDLRALVAWMLRELGPDVPLHFSRFHPQYRLTNLSPTPVETLTAAWEMARKAGLRYVYVGNVPDHPGNHTYCPACGKRIIVRQGFGVLEYHLKGERCAYCRRPIPGVWWPAKPEGAPVRLPPGRMDL
jgi:pyruvate formate lyase activating enzyme